MTQYDNWKRRFLFPTTPLLGNRASWTVGAAALIARHGKLQFSSAACKSQLAPKLTPTDTIYEEPYPPSIQRTPLRTPDYLIQPTSPIDNPVLNPFSLFNLVFYALAVLSLVIMIYRRVRKSCVPVVQGKFVMVSENTPTRLDRIKAFFGPRNIMISGPDNAAFYPKDVKHSSLA